MRLLPLDPRIWPLPTGKQEHKQHACSQAEASPGGKTAPQTHSGSWWLLAASGYPQEWPALKNRLEVP